MRAIDRPLIRLQVRCAGDPGDQLELVRARVVPRFVAWCEWLGLRVRTGRCPTTARARAETLELRLPVCARSPRIDLADQIFADLCAVVAASRPDHFALILPLPRLLVPDPPEPSTPPSAGASLEAEGLPRTTPGGVEGTNRAPCSDDGGARPAGPDVAHLPPARLIVFEVWSGDRVVDKHRIVSRKIVLGRHADCDIRLRDATVNRRHACIDDRDAEVVIEDLRSTNGTWVNGKRIERCRLRSGDSILLGRAAVRVDFSDGPRPLWQPGRTR